MFGALELNSLSTVVGLVATLASLASIYVSLYVKSCIGPILARLQVSESHIEQHRVAGIGLWKELRGLSDRLTRLETLQKSCSHCPNEVSNG